MQQEFHVPSGTAGRSKLRPLEFLHLLNQGLTRDGAWICDRCGPGGARDHSPRLQPWEKKRNTKSPGRALQATPVLVLSSPDKPQIFYAWWSESSSERCVASSRAPGGRRPTPTAEAVGYHVPAPSGPNPGRTVLPGHCSGPRSQFLESERRSCSLSRFRNSSRSGAPAVVNQNPAGRQGRFFNQTTRTT